MLKCYQISKINMEENNFIFYSKRFLLNRYVLMVLLLFLTAGLFYLNQGKLGRIVDMNNIQADLDYDSQLRAQQAELAALGLEKDPGQLSYVEIMQMKDYDFSDQEALKNRDSDYDGLSDFEEIYIYQTSAYLEDSDGDKITDSNEIKDGTDPLCALGDICGVDQLEKEMLQKEELIEMLYADEDSALVDELTNIDIATMDIDILRQSLLNSGLSQSELDQISDTDLRQLYESALGTYQAGNNPEEIVEIKKEDLANLTIGEIRALLIQQGADQSKLDEITDEDLLDLYNETIKELENKK